MSPAPVSALGSRLLPSLVDEIALDDPHRILYSFTKTSDPADGFLDVNARTFARAVDRFSWYLEDKLGPAHNSPTVTYMGPQDIIYVILILACSKTGYVPLFNSLRNTIDIHLGLLEQTNCDIFLLPSNFRLPVVDRIVKGRAMRVLEIPPLQYWLEKEPEPKPYPYTKSFAEARLEPLVILHSSGSTGRPKPITLTNGTVSPMDAFTSLHLLGHEPTFPALCAGSRVYISSPFFHSAGLCLLLPGCLYSGFTAVFSPFPVSPGLANGIHVHGDVQHTVLAPFTLIEIVKDPEYLKNIGRLKHVIFGGGLLPQDAGDRLSAHSRLINCFGSTECGVLPIEVCDSEDWAYVKVSPVLGHQYRHISGDLYEQVIVRDPALDIYQGVFSTFPDLQEWRMKDVYSPHPTKKDVWLYQGRTDDIIVFSTGEKINPYEMECAIVANPAVTAVLVVGSGRIQSSLLLETATPPTSEEERERLVDEIWPTVQVANSHCPSYGRVHRNMILFTSAEKPAFKASKGTVQRQATLDLYSKELDDLYEVSNKRLENVLESVSGSYDDPERSIKEIISICTDIKADDLRLESDLFENGLDSLQVTVLSRALNGWLSSGGHTHTIEAKTIYSNPTIAGLLTVVVNVLHNIVGTGDTTSDTQKMQMLYDQLTDDMPLRTEPVRKWPERLTVLLTGSTGSLGSYVLRSLLRDPRISRIYCLCRGGDGLARMQSTQAEKGFPGVDDRVTCLNADFSKPYLGLSTQEQYDNLLDGVTTIIHCAWKVDFNLSIDSFRTHLYMIRQLVEFSTRSSYGTHIFFVSSIGTVSNWQGPVPEQIFDDWTVPQAIGYAQSKFVAERILDTAAKQAGVSATICRVGQIAGPTTTAGIWPKKEWLPSLIASSKYLGKLPSSLGRADLVDWTPVDLLGQIIVELSKQDQAGATVFHVVNPRKSRWGDLVSSVQQYLGNIETVSFDQWLHILSESKAEDVNVNPAVKLVDYFQSLEESQPVILDTTNAASISRTLMSLEAVRNEWMDNWMRQWGF
ncbi:hypothetical protein GGS20DRAFT_553164 [Poronia punctata]|nr:hypothetical protein GGS20DRAFT_553164 [Poronia punctata]